MQIQELKCTLIKVYIPPGNKIEFFRDIFETITKWLEGDKSDLIILSDCHFPEMGQWTEEDIAKLREKL